MERSARDRRGSVRIERIVEDRLGSSGLLRGSRSNRTVSSLRVKRGEVYHGGPDQNDEESRCPTLTYS